MREFHHAERIGPSTGPAVRTRWQQDDQATVGTVMGSVALSGSSLAVGLAVLAAFYLLQAGIALLRRNTRFNKSSITIRSC